MLEKRLSYFFKRPQLLEQALSHTSLRKGPFQRLEFLGDRVLGLVIAQWLYELYPKEPEGYLTKRLAQLVKKETLLDVAKDLDLSSYVMVGSFPVYHTRIMSDVCEAIIGAIYIDGQLTAAEGVIRTLWQDRIKHDKSPPIDAKSELQEYLQAHKKPLPTYQVQSREGKDHAPLFSVRLVIADNAIFYGQGLSKKAAEQIAAKKALHFYKESLDS